MSGELLRGKFPRDEFPRGKLLRMLFFPVKTFGAAAKKFSNPAPLFPSLILC